MQGVCKDIDGKFLPRMVIIGTGHNNVDVNV